MNKKLKVKSWNGVEYLRTFFFKIVNYTKAARSISQVIKLTLKNKRKKNDAKSSICLTRIINLSNKFV